MLAMVIHAIALVVFLSALAHAQRVLVVSVGRNGQELALGFSPEEMYADVGDAVQFQFYPLNHSAVEANFEKPCVPTRNDTAGQGFFSGFRPLPLDTRIITTFTINVTHSDPIFFYCSQGRHCQQGFVGAINPTLQKSLAAFKASASLAPENLSPGEVPTVPTITLTQRPPPNFNFTSAGNGKTTANVGVIVGSVLGGAIFLVLLVTFIVFLMMQRKVCENEDNRGATHVGGYVIGRPDMVMSSNYGMGKFQNPYVPA